MMRPEQERVLRELAHHASDAIRLGGLALASWLDAFECVCAELTEEERDDIATLFESKMSPVRAGLTFVAHARRARDAEPTAYAPSGAPYASSRAWAWCDCCGESLVFVFDGREPRCDGCELGGRVAGELARGNARALPPKGNL